MKTQQDIQFNLLTLSTDWPIAERGETIYLQMDEDGCLASSTQQSSETGVSTSIWHQRTLQWRVAELYGIDNETLHELACLLHAVHEGHDIEWNGNNHVGTLTDVAAAASIELRDLLSQHLAKPRGYADQDWWADTINDGLAARMTLEDFLGHIGFTADIKEEVHEDTDFILVTRRADLERWYSDALAEARA